MEKERKIFAAKSAVLLAVIPALVYAYQFGPDPRKTGAPGDSTCAQAGCHGGGKVNVGGGKVEVSFPNGLTYTPGVTQRLTVTITDSQAKVYGFQLTARLDSKPASGQAGDLSPLPGDSVFVLCDDGSVKGSKSCPAQFPVQFIEHNAPRRTNTFTFDWTPPATDQGSISIYVAGNGANGNQQADPGDHIYMASYTLTPASGNQQKPAIAVQNGVVNAASFQAGIASGAWMTIFGANLASTTRIWGNGDFNGNLLPTQLDGVSVNIDGKPAAIYFISPGQINVQVPADDSVGPVQVQVITPQGTSDPATAQLQKFAPGFFLVSGTQYVAAVHQDGTYVGKPNLIPGGNFRPAQPGETILLYGTGFGATNPLVPTGQIFSGAAPLATAPTILIGGAAANVAFAGLAGAGLYQFNLTVPATAPDGDAAVAAQIGGQSTQPNIFVTIQK